MVLLKGKTFKKLLGKVERAQSIKQVLQVNQLCLDATYATLSHSLHLG